LPRRATQNWAYRYEAGDFNVNSADTSSDGTTYDQLQSPPVRLAARNKKSGEEESSPLSRDNSPPVVTGHLGGIVTSGLS
jgi:hypothetical protein